MNKTESKRLLDTARPAAKTLPRAGALANEPALDWPSQAADDGQSAWDLVSFPDGWYAGC